MKRIATVSQHRVEDYLIARIENRLLAPRRKPQGAVKPLTYTLAELVTKNRRES